MLRLEIANGLFQCLLQMDPSSFFADPYAQATRALMLADTLIAANEMTGAGGMSSAAQAEPVAIEIDVGVRAAKANFALRHLDQSAIAQRRARLS